VEEQKEIKEIKIDHFDKIRIMELDACTNCGECIKWCPVIEVAPELTLSISPPAKIRNLKKILTAQYGLRRILFGKKDHFFNRLFRTPTISKEDMKQFVNDIYACTSCRQCHMVCPAHIETVELWEGIRRCIVDAGFGPLESQGFTIEGVTNPQKINPFGEPRGNRGTWLPKNKVPIESKYLYFVGCAASYSVNRIPRSVIRVLDMVKDFHYTLLGNEEFCCGDPIARIGLTREADELVAKNVEKFEGLGIETVFASCSGCYKNLLHRFPKKYKVLHVTELFEKLIGEGRLCFTKDVKRKAIFFDGCDSGRMCGLYEPPRNILKAIPGIEVLDFDRNRAYGMCCGGPLSGSHPDLGYRIAANIVKEAREKGVDMIVTICPTCMITLREGAKSAKVDMEIQDLPMLLPGLLEGR